jgi:hypothetical protein
MNTITLTDHTCPLCSANFQHGRQSNFITEDGEPTLICGPCWDAAEGLVCSLCDRLAANYYGDAMIDETEWETELPAGTDVICYDCAWDYLAPVTAQPDTIPGNLDRLLELSEQLRDVDFPLALELRATAVDLREAIEKVTR